MYFISSILVEDAIDLTYKISYMNIEVSIKAFLQESLEIHEGIFGGISNGITCIFGMISVPNPRMHF